LMHKYSISLWIEHMKFKNFLKEQEGPFIRDWFEQFNVYADGHIQKNGLLYNANGPLEYSDVSLETKDKVTFDPPMESSWWYGGIDSLMLYGVGQDKITFPNFKKFPDVPTVMLTGSIVLSLEGIENCKRLRKLSFGHELEFKCGLLRLMKIPKSCEFEFDDGWIPEDSNPLDERLEKALKIVNDYRQDNNVVECVDELIAEGLKEYAKL
jgi:hypothetical protein